MVESVYRYIGKWLPPNSVGSNAVKIYLVQFFTVLTGLVSGILIARLLGPAGKGVFDLYRTLSTFIAEIGALGLGYGCLYYLANKNAPLKKIHGSILLFTLVSGVVALLVGLAGLPLWKGLFPGLQTWIILLAFFLSFSAIYLNIWLFVMLGINKAVDSHKIRLLFSSITLVVTLALWALGILTTSSMIWAAALVAVFNSAVAFVYILRKEPGIAFDSQLMKQSLSYGSLLFLGAVANIIHFKIDQVMVNYFLGPAAVGIYAVSVSWAERLFMLDAALLSSATYKISASPSAESIALTGKVFKAQALISAAGAFVLGLLAYPLVIFLYGADYRGAVLPLVLLLPGIFAWSVSRIHAIMMIYNCGQGSFYVKAAILASLVNMLFNYIWLGILHGNINGVAIVSSLSYALLAVSVYMKSRKVASASTGYLATETDPVPPSLFPPE